MDESKLEVARQLVSIFVNMRINKIMSRGNIKHNWDMYRSQMDAFNDRYVNEPSFTENMISKSTKFVATAESFNQMCEMLAILSFSPGGVEFLGLKFQAPVS